MRFIENADLREWVKDNLKKTIFQKAHALATQTGCEILVKMKDVTDVTSHQCYATGSLKRSYHGNAFRRVPGERVVSGETGLPSVDRSVQIGDESEDGSSSIGDEGSAIPLHLSVENAETDTSVDSQDMGTGVKIKVELDEDTGGSQTEQGLMTDASGRQISYPMEAMDTSQMTSYQSVSTGFAMPNQGSNSQKYAVPISPKPYQCAMCHKAFRSVQVLQKHTQTFHMRPGHGGSTRGRGRGRGLNQFAKTLAYKQQTQQALISRQAELQSQSFTCVICNQTFDRPELLSEHITNSHSDGNSLSATLPGLSTQFDVDQSASISDVDISHSQVIPFPHSAPSGLDLTSGGLTQQQQQQPYVLQSPFKYQHGPDTSSSNRPSTSGGHSGSPGSKRKWSFQRKEVTIRTIMSAILLSAGPISTHYAVRRYGPKYLRTPSIPKEQYVLAATALQEAKLGMLVTVKNATGLSDTFIKRAPGEIEEDLKQNSDLATIEEYTFRFHAPPPACITPTMQASIIQHGLLPPGSFSERKIRPQTQPTHISMNMNPSQIQDLRLLQIPTSLIQTLSTQSAKVKKETIEMLEQQQGRVVPMIHTSVGQAVMSSSFETLPTMVPDASYQSSPLGLSQDLVDISSVHTSGGQTVMSSSHGPLPSTITPATYQSSMAGSNQDTVAVSSVHTSVSQNVMSSSPDSIPTMVPTYEPSSVGLNPEDVATSVDSSVVPVGMTTSSPQISESRSVDDASPSIILDASDE